MAEMCLREKGPLSQVCFHCQQAAEKSLKAYIISTGKVHPRTHELVTLAKACEGLGESLAPSKTDIEFLDLFYVPARYPDAPVSTLPEGNPTPNIAERALNAARRLCDLVAASLKPRS